MALLVNLLWLPRKNDSVCKIALLWKELHSCFLPEFLLLIVYIIVTYHIDSGTSSHTLLSCGKVATLQASTVYTGAIPSYEPRHDKAVTNSSFSFTLMTHSSRRKREGVYLVKGWWYRSVQVMIPPLHRLIKHLASHPVKKSAADSLTCFLEAHCALIFLAQFHTLSAIK